MFQATAMIYIVELIDLQGIYTITSLASTSGETPSMDY